MIWLTSDWHLFHDKEFIYKARGFSSIEEMNEQLLARHNQLVTEDDIVYVLGDVLLGGDASLEKGISLIKKFHGHKILIKGNHCTNNRIKAFKENQTFEEVYDAYAFKYNGYHFYLSHYPTLTGNLEKESLKQCTLNLFGHTHQTKNFFYDLPYCYHVGVDSHNCYPVSIDRVIEDMKSKVQECTEML